jgi:guanylate kinase
MTTARTQAVATVNIPRRGLLFVMSSPSGAGKTTLSRKLLAEDRHISMSVSVTTRKPRPGEVDGKDYHFISKDAFEAMVETNELLEWANVFGNLYGTPRKPVESALQAGRDVLFDIDWQGTQQLAQAMKDDLVRLFILPPAPDVLRERLIKRAQDSSAVIAKRMAEAAHEISHWPEYDYVVVNDDLELAHQQVLAILTAERLKRRRQLGLTEFVRRLTREL